MKPVTDTQMIDILAQAALRSYYKLSRYRRLTRLPGTKIGDIIDSLKLGTVFLQISEKVHGKYRSVRVVPNDIGKTQLVALGETGPFTTIWVAGYNVNVPVVKPLRYLKVK